MLVRFLGLSCGSRPELAIPARDPRVLGFRPQPGGVARGAPTAGFKARRRDAFARSTGFRGRLRRNSTGNCEEPSENRANIVQDYPARWNDENGQSAGDSARACLTGLKWM